MMERERLAEQQLECVTFTGNPVSTVSSAWETAHRYNRSG